MSLGTSSFFPPPPRGLIVGNVFELTALWDICSGGNGRQTRSQAPPGGQKFSFSALGPAVRGDPLGAAVPQDDQIRAPKKTTGAGGGGGGGGGRKPGFSFSALEEALDEHDP